MMWTGGLEFRFNLVRLCLFALICSTLSLGYETATTSSYLNSLDKSRLKRVFSSAWTFKDPSTVFYGILGYKLLGEAVPSQKELCQYLLDSANKSPTVETYYFVTIAWKALGSCQGTLPTKQIVENLNGVLEKDGSSILEMYQAVMGLKGINKDLPNQKKIITSLKTALKKDDSISNVGYALHIAGELGAALGSFAMDRIEDAVVQADEVDGKFLQFEGGLTITALLVSGAYRLATVVDKPPAITSDQVVKFANYFLSRKSVQTPKGAHSLLNVLTILADNKFQVPVVVNVLNGGVVGVESPSLSLRVSDVLGNQIPGQLSLTLESATWTKNSVIVISKIKFVQSTDKTVYVANIMESKPEAGVYKCVISVSGGGKKLVGGIGVNVMMRVAGVPIPEPMQLGAADADQTTPPKLHTIRYPGQLGVPLELDSQQKLVVRFNLKDKSNDKPLIVHQAFLRLVHTATNQEVIFVADRDTNNNYKLDLDIGGKAGELGWVSGKYKAQLLIGDVILAHSFAWNLADINLKLATEPLPKTPSMAPYTPKPNIQHLFREPEKRPAVFVSNLFTALVLLPLLVLFGQWIKLGINISNFPFSLSAIGFHLGLGGIFALFGMFWLSLNMFETLKYLIGLGIVTFLCGNKMLAKIAANRKH